MIPVVAPHLTVMKETTSTPANGEAYVLNEPITYRITVTNDGNVTVTRITVIDELTGDEWQIQLLAPGQTRVYDAEHRVTEADILAGVVVNVATATGTSPDSEEPDVPVDPGETEDPDMPEEPDVPVDPGETEDPTEPGNPHLTAIKTVTSTPANGAFYTRGETVRYEITVINDGNLTVTDIGVTDSLSTSEGQVIANIPSLAPGASQVIPFEHVVTDADVAAGNVHNVASAVAPNPEAAGNTPVTPGEVDVPARMLRLTVNYWYDRVGGTPAASSYTNLYSYGQPYNVASPRIPGYSADLMYVIGTITEDTVVDVVYTRNSYTLTVQYRYLDGTVAATDTVMRNMRYGDPYTIASPVIAGYVANQTSVSGVMPEGNVVLTVYYAATPARNMLGNEPPRMFVLIDEYGIPLGVGNVVMNVGDCFE